MGVAAGQLKRRKSCRKRRDVNADRESVDTIFGARTPVVLVAVGQINLRKKVSDSVTEGVKGSSDVRGSSDNIISRSAQPPA